MNINNMVAAIVSYLTGAIAIYAYVNRNRYLDLAIATVAIFIFGTSMLFAAFKILPEATKVLLNLSTAIMAIAILFFFVRLASGASNAIRRWSRRRK